MPLKNFIHRIFNIQNSELFYQIPRFISTVLILFLLFLGIYLVVTHFIKRHEKLSKLTLLTKTRKALRAPVIILLLIISLVLPLSFSNFDTEIIHPAWKILTILTIIVISWLLINAVKLIKHVVLNKYDIDQKDNLKARKVYTQFRILEQISIVLILIVAISLILISFDGIRKIGVSLIASAGIIGIILGFAAQRLIGTFLAGIQLAITQPIRLEDVVIVENEWGLVEEINLTYVVIRIWDKRRLIVPSNYFIEKPFQNWTRTSAEILGTVFIYTDYTVPFDALRAEVSRLLKDNALWDGKVNVLQVTNATERTVEVRVLISAVDSPTAWNLRVFLREKMIDFLQKNYPGSLPKSRVSLTKDETDSSK